MRLTLLLSFYKNILLTILIKMDTIILEDTLFIEHFYWILTNYKKKINCPIRNTLKHIQIWMTEACLQMSVVYRVMSSVLTITAESYKLHWFISYFSRLFHIWYTVLLSKCIELVEYKFSAYKSEKSEVVKNI